MKNKRKYWLIGVGVFLFAVCTLLIYILAPAYLDVFLVFFVGCVLCAVAIAKFDHFYGGVIGNEAHLRCMKNEAGLRPMKRAFGSRKSNCALRFIRA